MSVSFKDVDNNLSMAKISIGSDTVSRRRRMYDIYFLTWRKLERKR